MIERKMLKGVKNMDGVVGTFLSQNVLTRYRCPSSNLDPTTTVA